TQAPRPEKPEKGSMTRAPHAVKPEKRAVTRAPHSVKPEKRAVTPIPRPGLPGATGRHRLPSLEASTMQRPAPTEHIPYYERYIALVPEGDVLEVLESQLEDLRAFVAAVPREREGHRYASGKWTLREVLGHLIDTERVMAYRAFAIARGEI